MFNESPFKSSWLVSLVFGVSQTLTSMSLGPLSAFYPSGSMDIGEAIPPWDLKFKLFQEHFAKTLPTRPLVTPCFLDNKASLWSFDPWHCDYQSTPFSVAALWMDSLTLSPPLLLGIIAYRSGNWSLNMLHHSAKTISLTGIKSTLDHVMTLIFKAHS